MALTAEQENSIEFVKANAEANKAADIQRHKLDMVRLAKDILAENDRNKPVGERGIVAADIISLAEELITYIKS